MCSALANVGYGPEADMIPLFDNLKTPPMSALGQKQTCTAAKRIAIRSLAASSGQPRTVWFGLRELHIPENRRSELEDVPDVLSERRRLNPFSPRHVCNFAESDPLDLVGELLPFHLVSCAHPVGDKLFELRDVRPAEPSARTCARYAKMDGGISDIRGRPT